MRRNVLLSAFVLLFLGLTVEPALAQKFEVDPYGGFFFPGHWRDNFQMKREGIYGFQAGGFVTDRWEIEGNLAYINHWRFENNSGTKSRAFIYEVGPTVNFYSNLFQNVFPYVTAKVGGLTGYVSGDDGNIASPGTPPVIVDNHDTFLQFSYGGGLKAWDLLGPVGFRAEVRGRTMPNFFGNSMTTLETTAGLTFTFGER